MLNRIIISHGLLAVLLVSANGFAASPSKYLEQASNESEQSEPEAPEAPSLCLHESQENTVLDSAYDYINTKMCEPALWFDDFFVDDRVTDDARAGTSVRWKNDFIYVEGKGFEFETRLNARVRIPKATRKLKLTFENEADDRVRDLFPDSTDDTKSTLGLRYDWIVKSRSSFNIKVTLHPGAQARYRYTYPFSDTTYGRFTQKIYQKEKDTGSTTSLDLDHTLSDDFVLRWTNFAKFETSFDGAELGTGLTLYQYLNDKQALVYEASLYGRTQPYRYLASQRLAVKFRHNVFRKWFFYEVIPEVNWKEEEYEKREDETRLTLRLEVLFNNI